MRHRAGLPDIFKQTKEATSSGSTGTIRRKAKKPWLSENVTTEKDHAPIKADGTPILGCSLVSYLND
jgi:hypothetical protein